MYNKTFDIALAEIRESRLKDQRIVERVQNGMRNLLELQPSKHAIQVNSERAGKTK